MFYNGQPLDAYAAIGFDVDGTLVQTKSGAIFRQTPDDWEWLPGRKEALIELVKSGFYVFFATNQGGVAIGKLKEVEMQAELERLCTEIGVEIAHLRVCYTLPTASIPAYRAVSDRRKPGGAMLTEAIEEADTTPGDTLFVGDRAEDETAAARAGCHFMNADAFFTVPAVQVMSTQVQEVLASCLLTGQARLEFADGQTFVRFFDEAEPVPLTDLSYLPALGLHSRSQRQEREARHFAAQ